MPRSLSVPLEMAGARLDVWLTQELAPISRAKAQAMVREGRVRVGGALPSKPGVLLEEAAPPDPTAGAQAEDIPLAVVFEDEDVIVIDKPPGIVVHPAPGHAGGTLVNALLHHSRGKLSTGSAEGRPGIVHRLDKDTSGLLAVAKHDAAHAALGAQFAGRTIEKRYLAVARGWPRLASGRIETYIDRHPVDRQKMAVPREPERGRNAVTDYRVRQKWPAEERGVDCALIECRLHTGRTHQIRVHLKHLGHPILGDELYGGPTKEVRPPATRQLLHAWVLGFDHPRTGQRMRLIAPPPADFAPYAFAEAGQLPPV